MEDHRSRTLFHFRDAFPFGGGHGDLFCQNLNYFAR
jgi:hypothetical protein